MTSLMPNKDGDGPVVMTQVKSINFDDLMRSDSPPYGESGTPTDDLATIEANKKNVQKYVHEQESFWSWFCCRCLCCDGYYPCYWPDCFWFGTGSGDCCTCDCCNDCCSGLGSCCDGCCDGCGDCCGECMGAFCTGCGEAICACDC